MGNPVNAVDPWGTQVDEPPPEPVGGDDGRGDASGDVADPVPVGSANMITPPGYSWSSPGSIGAPGDAPLDWYLTPNDPSNPRTPPIDPYDPDGSLKDPLQRIEDARRGGKEEPKPDTKGAARKAYPNEVKKPLRRLHPDSTLTGPTNQSSYNYWSNQPTQAIIDSLASESEEPLTVDPNGTI